MNSYQRIFFAADYGNVFLILRKDKVVSEELKERITVLRSRFNGKVFFLLNVFVIIFNKRLQCKKNILFAEPSLIGSLVIVISRLLGFKSIIDIWDIPFRYKDLSKINRFIRFIEIKFGMFTFKLANLYLVMRSLKDFELTKLKLNSRKILYFNNAVRFEKMQDFISKERFEEFSIVMQRSYYTYGYGFELMISAFDILRSQIKAKLIIIGIINKELEAFLHSSNYESDIVCTGSLEIEKCWDYISKSHIAVIPFPKIIDLEQVLPIKAIEYLFLGKAIVYTDLFGLNSIIGEDGYCVKDISPDGIANAILSIYNNPNKLEEFEFRALNRAKKFNAKDKHKKLFTEIFERIF